jgi:hypothetical protein
VSELRELSDAEHHETLCSPMAETPDYRIVESRLDDYCERWMDVLAGRHQVTDLYLEHVWLNAAETYEHIAFETNHQRVYLMIVHDLKARAVLGHHLLDINEKYGLPSPLKELGLK